MNKAIIIQADDWEGLFVNGVLVQEGHSLNQGYKRLPYLKKLSEEYNFNLEDLIEVDINEVDEEYLDTYGGFPPTIDQMKGVYDENDGDKYSL